MHVRGCYCDACNPGAPLHGAGFVRIETKEAPTAEDFAAGRRIRHRLSGSTRAGESGPWAPLTKEQQNARAYLKRKLASAT